MVKLRLKRTGKKHEAIYRIVAADARSPRDGKFIEEIGFYNPHTKEIRVDVALKDKWLKDGAVASETVKALFTKFEGVKSTKDGKATLVKKPAVKKAKAATTAA